MESMRDETGSDWHQGIQNFGQVTKYVALKKKTCHNEKLKYLRNERSKCPIIIIE